MKKIAILASGAGSNARNILLHFQNSNDVKVDLIASNKVDAGVLNIAKEFGVETFILNKENFIHGDSFLNVLQYRNIDAIVLAGFLWKVPGRLVSAFPRRIMNIHPALLPKYGGKGMYGHFVHEAVLQNRDSESGITIHFVNENYDEGQIIFQKKVAISPTDGSLDIERKVRSLEIEFFPEIIERVLTTY